MLPRLMHRLTLGAAMAGAVALLAACGRDEAGALAEVKGKMAYLDAAETSAALKGVVQRFPRSAPAHQLQGLFLIGQGDLTGGAAALERALELQQPPTQVVPPLARAWVQSNRAKRVIDELAPITLSDPAAQADFQATLAAAWVKTGQPDKASTTLDDALKLQPDAQALLLARAKLAAATGQKDRAAEALKELLAKHPTDAEGWALQGDLLLRPPMHRDQAVAAFQRALQHDPKQVHAHAALVTLHLSRHAFDAAEKQLAALRQAAPEHFSTAFLEARLASARGEGLRARSLYQKLIKSAPDHPILLVSAAENELRLQAFGQAETLAAKALSLAPNDLNARRIAAQALLRKGQAGRAVVMLGPAADKPEAPADLLALAALAQAANDNPRTATELYARVLRVAPNEPRLRLIALTEGGQRPLNEAMLSQLQQLAATDPGTVADLAVVQARLKAKQWDAALKAVEALQRKLPGTALPLQVRAHVLAQRQDLEGARQVLDAALALEPSNLATIEAQAQLDLLSQRPAEARDRFKALLAQQPKNAAALLALARVTARASVAPSEVLGDLKRAVAADALHAPAHLALVDFHTRRGDLPAALAAAAAATAALPDNADMLEREARLQLSSGKTDLALVSFTKLASLQTRSPTGHLGQAQAHLDMGNPSQAQRSVERALERDPRGADTLSMQVVVHLANGRHKDALDKARSLQAEQPDLAAGWQMEARVHQAQGNQDAALTALRQAVTKAVAGRAPQALHQALQRTADHAGADAFAERWLRDHPQDQDFLFYAAAAAQAAGQATLAERRYRALLALAPEHADALNNLAMLHLGQRQADALALADKAVALRADDPQLLDTQAQARAAAGQLPQAVQAQTKATALAPQSAMLRLNLVRLLVKQGDRNEAKAELGRIVEAGLNLTESQREELQVFRQVLK